MADTDTDPNISPEFNAIAECLGQITLSDYEIALLLIGLPLCQDLEEPDPNMDKLLIHWVGPANRRIAFEVADLLGPEGAKGLLNFALLVQRLAA